jgi:hypothetical protein
MAQQYLHRARMFRGAAMQLVDYSNGEQFLPKYALLMHAIELALKAFARYSVASGKPPHKEPSNHDLVGWYRLALEYGLDREPGVAANIDILSPLHFSHYTRYPLDQGIPVADLSVIADTTVDHLIDTFTQVINRR